MTSEQIVTNYRNPEPIALAMTNLADMIGPSSPELVSIMRHPPVVFSLQTRAGRTIVKLAIGEVWALCEIDELAHALHRLVRA